MGRHPAVYTDWLEAISQRDGARRELAETQAKLAKAQADLVSADEYRRFVVECNHVHEYIEWAARKQGNTELAEAMAMARETAKASS